MSDPARAAEIDARLRQLYPRAAIALAYESDFQLLVAVILSAQTTDVGVNKVTPVLFERFPTPALLAAAAPAGDAVAAGPARGAAPAPEAAPAAGEQPAGPEAN